MRDEHLLRDLAPQVLAALTRRSGDFAAAEDATQEALLAAAQTWPVQGQPDNPRAWLLTVASRRLADHARADQARRLREARAAALDPEPDAAAPPPDAPPEDDDTLLLLLMCCHPAVPRAAAIALTLRAVGGLTTRQIARAFLLPEPTLAQRISRARRSIQEAGGRFEPPSPADLPERLTSTLHVLYLIFTEGHAHSAGPDLQRPDLAAEALRLTREVHRRLPDHAEAAGLLALMLLTHARRDARSAPNGALIPLDGQDRARWDAALIQEGIALLERTLPRGAVGPYQLQAAIAALHDEAPCVEDTDWPQILALYTLLQRMTDNPMIALNRAVADAMVHGPLHALEGLLPLDADPRVASHHRLAAVRGHLYARAGDPERAAAYLRRAAQLTASLPERDYLLLTAARLASEAG